MIPNTLPSTYGRATIDPTDDVVAGSFGTWTVTLTVGHHGIDDGGRVLIARFGACNWGDPQCERPDAANFTTVHTSGQAQLRAHFDAKAHIRPWKPALVIDVDDGSLAPGDTVTVILGDTSFGSPGSRAQTFAQERYEFRVLVDPFGTGQAFRVPDPPMLRVIGGPAVQLRVRAPSEVVVNQPFPLTVAAEDRYGNPADGYQGTVRLATEAEGAQLPGPHVFQESERGAHRFTDPVPTLLPQEARAGQSPTVPMGLHRDPWHRSARTVGGRLPGSTGEGLKLPQAGTTLITARDETGQFEATSNPIVCYASEPSPRLYWGDMHGQTEASVGVGSFDEYFAFGRDVAALDFISHCANDFHITQEHWRQTRDAVHRFHEPGRYVTFLGYEWSGLTPGGGDHNVYFRGADGPPHRSSHWLIPDQSDRHTDRYPISALHDELRGRDDVMVIPHIGGRYADLDFFDTAHTPFIEIASVHGVFEWFARDALRRGLRVGFVANSDDHSCRPGATYPSGTDVDVEDPVHLGVRGGLMAVYAEALTREALWEAFWARRCYGTTGERIILRISADDHPMGAEFSASQPALFEVEVLGTAPLETVELLRGPRVVYTHSLVEPQPDERPLLKLTWEGARINGRKKICNWSGSLGLSDGRILSAEPFAFDCPEQGITARSDQEVRWRSTTAGDLDGLFLDLEAPEGAALTFQSPPITFTFQLADLDQGPLTSDAGGFGQRVTAAWVPRGPRPTAARFSYRDASAPEGTNAYWLRVIQRDGAMAWSSPIFVELTR